MDSKKNKKRKQKQSNVTNSNANNTNTSSSSSSIPASSIASAGAWAEISPPLNPTTLQTLSTLDFQQMTPVQAAAIPLFLTNKDVVVQAVTGSGKTLAFVIPILEILFRCEEPLKKNQVGAIIIEPTRELAKQVAEVLGYFLKDATDFTTGLYIGGVTKLADDIAHFRKDGASIVVATPGRLEEILNKVPDFNVKELEVLVLDEADRLLDMGFELSLNVILSKLPKQRRTGLFSATMSEGLTQLVRAGLRNPVKVTVKIEGTNVATQSIPASLTIYYTVCEPEMKFAQLCQYLLNNKEKKLLVYFASCACVDYFYKIMHSMKVFRDVGFPIGSLHGQMHSKRRLATYEQFNKASSGALLCTDVAARGLDIPDVDCVVQYDPPQDPNSFVHRCGRTARLGKEGTALVFLLPEEDAYVDFMKLRKVPMTEYVSVPEKQLFQSPEQILLSIRTQCKQDRDIYEKSLKAFVSFVRAYKEHTCSHIFQFKNLDLGRMAKSFGLIKLPKMPELKNTKVNFEPENIDIYTIPYKDKQREKQRLFNLEKFREQRENEDAKPKKQKSTAWSVKKEQKEKKKKRKEIKLAKREYLKRKREEEDATAETSKNDKNLDEDDWEELQNDARLLKRRKKGKISEATLNAKLGFMDFEE